MNFLYVLVRGRVYVVLFFMFIIFGCSTLETTDNQYEILGWKEPIPKKDKSIKKVRNEWNKYFKSAKNDIKLMTPLVHSEDIKSVIFSPDGRYALSSDSGGVMILWEVTSGRSLKQFQTESRFDSTPFSIGFSMKKPYIFFNDNDSIKMLDIVSEKGLKSFKADNVKVINMSVSKDGKFILSHLQVGLIRNRHQTLSLLDVDTSKEIHAFNGENISPRHLSAMALSNDGRYAALVEKSRKNNNIIILDLDTGQQISVLKGHSRMVFSVAFSPNARTLVSGGKDDTIRIWDVISGKELRKMEWKSMIWSVDFSPDGKHVVSGSDGGTVQLWNTKTGKLIQLFKRHSFRVKSVSFSPDGRYVLSGGDEKADLKMWDVVSGKEIRTFTDQKISKVDRSLKSGKYSPDGRYIVFGSNGSIKLWDLSLGKEIKIFQGHVGCVNDVDFTPDGLHLVSGGCDGTLILWDIQSGKKLRTFRGHSDVTRTYIGLGSKGAEPYAHHTKGIIRSLDISKDGNFILSGSVDNTAKLWDLNTGEEIISFDHPKEHTDYQQGIYEVAISLNGKYAKTRAEEVKFWELPSGKMIDKDIGSLFHGALSPSSRRTIFSSLPAGSVRISDIAYSFDGKYVSVAYDIGKIYLWEASGAKLLKVLETKPRSSIESVSFSPDNKYILSVQENGSVRIWEIASGLEQFRILSSTDGEWLIFTPDGYYSNSIEGTSLVHGVTTFPDGLESFSLEQFEPIFKRPDIIQARLNGRKNAGKPVPILSKPPYVMMPDHMAIKKTNTTHFPLTLTASSFNGIKVVRIFVNGKASLEIPVQTTEKTLSLQVPILSDTNRITAIAYDERGLSSQPKYVDVISTKSRNVKPNLYVAAIGISDYPKLSSDWQLDYAHTDAKAITEAFKEQEGKLFREVHSNILTNEQATPQAIAGVLETLSAVKEDDLVIIFMAGHGVQAQNGTFHFLTTSGHSRNPRKGGLNWDILNQYLSVIKGRTILLLDACHSNSISTETVIPNNTLAEKFFSAKKGGVLVLSASKGRQSSLESPDIGGGFGIFTYAFTQGIGLKSREADINKNGYVEFMELVDYVQQYVNKETSGEQTPWLSRKELFGDFSIAVVRD